MAGLDEDLEAVGAPGALVGREEMRGAIAPIGSALELRDRQQFDCIHAEALQVVDEVDGVVERTWAGLAEAKRPDMQFVDD